MDYSKQCKNCDKLNSSIAKYCSSCGYELPKTQVENVSKPISKNNKSGNQKIAITILAGLVAFVVSFFLVQQFFGKSQSFDKALMKTASELNQASPVMVDSETRLDNTVAMPNKVFQYNYTLVNLEKSEADIDKLINYVKPNIINNAKTNPDMEKLRDNKVILNYHYRDKNGVFLFNINVTPAMYE